MIEAKTERDRAPLSLCLFVPVSIRTVLKDNLFKAYIWFKNLEYTNMQLWKVKCK